MIKRLILGALLHWRRSYVEIYKDAVQANIFNIYTYTHTHVQATVNFPNANNILLNNKKWYKFDIGSNN